MSLLHIFGTLFFLYVTVRLIVPSPLPLWGKLAATLAALAASQYHAFIRLSSGSLSSPEMPYALLVLASAGFVVMVFLSVVLVARDVARLGSFVVRRLVLRKTPRPASTVFSPGRRSLLVAGIGAAAGVAAFGEGVRVPDVRTTEVRLPNLPPQLDGFCLVQISDLHATALLRGPRVAAIVARVNALNPDCIVCTGDMIDGLPERRVADVAPLKDLRARYGVFGCEGNHEYYSGYAAWMRTFAALGLTLLHNAHTVITVRGAKLVLAGLDDPAGLRFGGKGPDIAKALAGAPDDAPVVLLAHQPAFARANAQHGVALQLSGHTHGGHFLGFDRIVASRNAGFVRGLYRVNAMQLYVSSGAGLWAGFPVRLGVPAEIARIILRSA